jgi:predicted molibdopterin-dependent oxidoreductase YjgC
MYIMGENPIISDPDVSHAEEWFHGLEFLAVQDLFLTETARYADVVLPGASFAEKDGTYVNTERRIQRANRAVDPPGNARPDLDILLDLSRRMGVHSPYSQASEVMDEIARVTPSWRGVSFPRLDGPGLQYPVEHETHEGTLDAREPTPTVELSPADAAELGIEDGDPVRVTSRRGSLEISVRISPRVARRQIFIPMHYREAAANLLTNPALDPYAGIPEFKVCAVRLERVPVKHDAADARELAGAADD